MRLGAKFDRISAAGGQLGALVCDLARVAAERRHHQPSPPREGLVLDIGAGHAPHPRADVIVDKYPADDFERGIPMNLSKPLVVADGHALPFGDGSFAYVIAQHVLEHATDPALFAAELARVGAAGFVQVPSRESELVYGWPFHPWLIDLEEGEFVFHPRGDARAPVGDFMHAEFEASILTRLGWAARRSKWHHSLRWRNHLIVRVQGSSTALETASLDVERTTTVLRHAPVPALPAAVAATLRCPACRDLLRPDKGDLICGGCHRRYPVAGNVPLLVVEAAA